MRREGGQDRQRNYRRKGTTAREEPNSFPNDARATQSQSWPIRATGSSPNQSRKGKRKDLRLEGDGVSSACVGWWGHEVISGPSRKLDRWGGVQCLRWRPSKSQTGGRKEKTSNNERTETTGEKKGKGGRKNTGEILATARIN